MTLQIPLPPEMEPYRTDLEYFFNTMVRKLYCNRHKGTGSDLNPVNMLSLCSRELAEAEKAMAHEGQFQFLVECCDVANMAFLATRGALQLTREEFDAVARSE
jgi:hypothetical protein